MAIINGNFTDSNGNLVNIADLLRGVTSNPENKDQVHPLAFGYLHGYLPLIKNALMATSHK